MLDVCFYIIKIRSHEKTTAVRSMKLAVPFSPPPEERLVIPAVNIFQRKMVLLLCMVWRSWDWGK